MPRENPLLTMIREVCALGRAEFTRPHTAEGDPGAQRELVRELRAIDPGGEPSDIALSLDLLAPRAPFFDRLVLDAIAAEIPQIVNLGAGYDDRALRFRYSGGRFFELDLADIVADKTRRLVAMGADTARLTSVTVDFRSDDVAAALASAGHDANRPTLFIAEHLALFLEPGDVERLLAAVFRRAAPGSMLAITAEVHPVEFDSDLVISTVDEVMFGGVGPLRTILSRDTWLALLARTGWRAEDTNEITKVSHFELPIADQPARIQTQFLTAVA